MKIYRYKNNTLKTEELITKSITDYLPLKFSPKILRNENGKPYFKDLNVHIGVTHTDDITIVAFHEENFGIDCETPSRTIQFSSKISDRYFSAKEKELSFIKAWTRKEAYAKFLGTRLFNVLSTDTFSLSGTFEFLEEYDLTICIYTEKNASL